MSSQHKVRLDQLLVDLKISETRSQALRQIMAGNVLVNDVPVTKAGLLIDISASVRLREASPWVSRAAYKLLTLFEKIPDLDLSGKKGLDIGASTGGFTQVLLSRGVTEVIALDVGHQQLHWKIKSDPRVQCIEHYNARNLRKEDLPFYPDVITIDVSFISLTKILEPAVAVLTPKGMLIALIKPQFELDKTKVESGGIVKDEAYRAEAISTVRQHVESLGLSVHLICPAGIKGLTGNQEYILFAQRE